MDDAVERLRNELVSANHVLLRHGIVDAFGHVSVRHPHDPARFLMGRRLAPGLVGPADIREFGLDGELTERDGTPVFLERFIHSEIFAARPDVQSVVHSHSPGIVAFSVVPRNRLRPVCHTCGFLRDGAPVFEMRDAAGPATDLLISSRAHGRSLVAALGDANVVLMRGHGSTAVGRSIAEAVFRAIYTESNAAVQRAATGLGPVVFLSREEAAASEAAAAGMVERTWPFWLDEIGVRP